MGLHAQLEPPCCSLSISRNSQAVQAALAPSPSPLMSRAAEVSQLSLGRLKSLDVLFFGHSV